MNIKENNLNKINLIKTGSIKTKMLLNIQLKWIVNDYI